jgi:hypothetical protein
MLRAAYARVAPHDVRVLTRERDEPSSLDPDSYTVKPCPVIDELFHLGRSGGVKQVQEVFNGRETPNGSDLERAYLCMVDEAAGHHGLKRVVGNLCQLRPAVSPTHFHAPIEP